MNYNYLYLHEEIMLIALKDEEGTIAPYTNYRFALSGALLAELLISNHCSIEENKKKKFIQIVNPGMTGDPILDECIEKIRTAKRPARIETWVSRFVDLKDIKNRTALQLVKRGILKADEDKVMMIFNRKIYPEINPIPEKQLIDRLHEAIFTDKEDLDPRTVVLISLAKSTDLLKVIFDKKKLKSRKKRIEQIINGEIIGKAAKEAIEALQAAVMVACIVPAIAATAAT